MEKKCKKCKTTENVNFDGFCKKCYEESINTKINESENNDETNYNILDTIKDKLYSIKLKEKIKTISIILLIFLIFCFAVSDDSQKNIELTKQVEQLTKQTEELKVQITTINNKLEETQKKLEEKTKEVTTLQEERTKLESEKQTLNQEIEELKTSKAKKTSTQTSTSSSLSSTTKTSNNSISNTEKDSTSNSYTVYITDTGKKYHSASCSYLKKSKHAISKSSAISQGYSACSKCNP